MPRSDALPLGDIVHYVLNRGNGRMGISRKPGNCEAFVCLILEAMWREAMELSGFCPTRPSN